MNKNKQQQLKHQQKNRKLLSIFCTFQEQLTSYDAYSKMLNALSIQKKQFERSYNFQKRSFHLSSKVMLCIKFHAKSMWLWCHNILVRQNGNFTSEFKTYASGNEDSQASRYLPCVNTKFYNSTNNYFGDKTR